jgi:hypothetical protein
MNTQPNNFPIPVYNGLLEHCTQMRDSIWLYLWLLDRQTTEEANGSGKVLGGMPIRDQDIAACLGGIATRTIRRWRERLLKRPYIEAINTGHGYSYRILKSKKWKARKAQQSGQKCPVRADKSVQSDRPDVSTQTDQNGHSDVQVVSDQSGHILPVYIDITETRQRHHRDGEANAARSPSNGAEENSSRLSTGAVSPELQAVWDYYIKKTGKHPTLYTFTEERKRIGEARFGDALNKVPGGNRDKAKQLMLICVDTMAASDFHQGKNDARKKYNDWELLFRSADKFEWWLERAANE